MTTQTAARSDVALLTGTATPRVGHRAGGSCGTGTGGSLLMTFSRRTPEGAREIMTRRLRALPGWIWRGSGPNPLFAFLEAADHILVTEDSANMAAEAASTDSASRGPKWSSMVRTS